MKMEDILKEFFTNYDKLDKLNDWTTSALSSVDKELAEFYHHIEGIHLSHNTQAHNYMVELQDILSRRRQLKADTILIRSFIDRTSPSMEKAKTHSNNAIKQHRKVLEKLKTKRKEKKC